MHLEYRPVVGIEERDAIDTRALSHLESTSSLQAQDQ
jgi:hypothetical protein